MNPRTNRLQHPRTLPNRQRGVNLIEIMVAMVIGLFLVIGATTLYVRSKRSADIDDSIARLQETARYGMSILEMDVRMANYWGMKKDGADIDNKVANDAATAGLVGSSNDCGTNYAIDVEQYIEATNNSYGLACDAKNDAVTDSDTLTVRRAASTLASSGSDTHLQICSNRKVANIVKDAGIVCDGELHNLIANAYYVDTGSDQNSAYPSLRRKTLEAGPEFNDIEIIPGVEDMQVQLGRSIAVNDPNAAQYVDPGASTAGQIVAVRVWLLVRAERAEPGYSDTQTYQYGDRTYTPNDNFRRLLVSRTFFVRNVTGT